MKSRESQIVRILQEGNLLGIIRRNRGDYSTGQHVAHRFAGYDALEMGVEPDIASDTDDGTDGTPARIQFVQLVQQFAHQFARGGMEIHHP
ncbi:MAG: hypothetical protein OHK0037_02200 [Elainellaceae cyanobacterium]